MCCGNCGNKPCGNFTYIRYASDKNGSDFSKTRNAGAIERCFQAIITSPIALDEESISFQNLFNGLWNDICASCACGCEFFAFNTPDYITQNGENTWTYNTSTAPTYSLDPAVANKLFIVKMTDGDSMIISNFRDGDDQPLVSGVEYCFEFNLVTVPSIWPDESLTLSLGNGPGATQIVIDSTTPLGYQKVKMTAQDGSIANAYQLFLQVAKTAGGTIHGVFQIKDFRFAPSNCCDEGGLQTCNIIMEQKDKFTLGEVVNFVATNFGNEVDVINAGVLEITRGDTQGIFNQATETAFNNPPNPITVSPEGTLWNSVYTDPLRNGFNDLSDVADRVYKTWIEAVNNQAGNELPALETVMYDTTTGKYYKVQWVSWGQSSGGSFEYNRQEINLITPCFIEFSDGTKQNTAAKKIRIGKGLTGTENTLSDGTVELLIESDPEDTWKISSTAFIDPQNGDDTTGVLGDGNKPFKTVSQGQLQTGVKFVTLLPGTYNEYVNVVSGLIYFSHSGVEFNSGEVRALSGTDNVVTWLGNAVFNQGSRGFNFQASGEYFAECQSFENSDFVAIIQNNAKAQINVKKGILCHAYNGGGFACSVRTGGELVLNTPYFYCQHALFSIRNTSRAVLNCPDAQILDNYQSQNYGDVYKTLLIGMSDDSYYFEFNGKCVNKHPVQTFSFGVSDGIITLANASSNRPTVIIKGDMIANKNRAIVIEYGTSTAYVEVSKGKIQSEIQPIYTDKVSASASLYVDIILTDCDIIGGSNIVLGQGRILQMRNCTLYNSDISSGAVNIEVTTNNPTVPASIFAWDCNAQCDAASSGQFIQDTLNTPTNLKNVTGNKPIGTGVTDNWSGYSQILSFTVAKFTI